MTRIPKAPITRIIKQSGAGRVSDDAAESLVNVLEDVGTQISELAIQYAQHAGRKTIKSDDILLAAETLFEG